jgi:MYXO-CTERM domain-containing protein
MPMETLLPALVALWVMAAWPVMAAAQPTPTPFPNGVHCAADNQCQSGHCNPAGGICCDFETCPAGEGCDIYGHEGSCSPPNTAGEPCFVDPDCAAGLVCVVTGMVGVCSTPASPTPTATLTPISTPTPRRTATPSATPTPSLTPTTSLPPAGSGGGCAVTAGRGSASWWLFAALALLGGARRRSRRHVRR